MTQSFAEDFDGFAVGTQPTDANTAFTNIDSTDSSVSAQVISAPGGGNAGTSVVADTLPADPGSINNLVAGSTQYVYFVPSLATDAVVEMEARFYLDLVQDEHFFLADELPIATFGGDEVRLVRSVDGLTSSVETGYVNPNPYRLIVVTASVSVIEFESNLPGGTWFHLRAAVNPGGGTYTLYYNGSPVYSGDTGTWPRVQWTTYHRRWRYSTDASNPGIPGGYVITGSAQILLDDIGWTVDSLTEPPPDVFTPMPPLRIHPRSDGLGLSSAVRVWPPPRSQQYGGRPAPGSYL